MNNNCDTKVKRFKPIHYTVFLIIGVLFGIVMTKSEAISWYRIFEMFRFQSFHMYGIMGSALIVAVLINQTIKRKSLKNLLGNNITFKDKATTYKRYIIGGTLFGMGWGLSGACPGPMYTLLGNGFLVFTVVIASALLGTYTYGLLRNRLPH